MKGEPLTYRQFLANLRADELHHDRPMFLHYESCDQSSVDIRSFKDYFMCTVSTLLVSQRSQHILVSAAL